MDLIWEYIIIMILLFGANITLLLNDFNLDKKKLFMIIIVYTMGIFLSSIIGMNLNFNTALINYIPWILLIVAIVVFISTVIHLINWKRITDSKKLLTNKWLPFLGIFLSSLIIILVFNISWKFTGSIYLNGLGLAILSLLISFLVYPVSLLLHNAKRHYSVVIGEFMFLESVLMAFFALTFSGVRNLDYSTFTSFLILTPTYQLLYVVIAIVAIFVGGILLNERVLKKMKRK